MWASLKDSFRFIGKDFLIICELQNTKIVKYGFDRLEIINLLFYWKLEIGNWKLGIFPVMLIDIGSDRTIVSVAVNGKINYCEKLQISSRFLKDLIERNWCFRHRHMAV